MQNTVETKKVGAGIITMSVLDFIGQFFVIAGCLINILFKDLMNSSLQSMGLVEAVNTT